MRALVLCSESTRAPGNPPRPHGLVDFQSAIERTSDIQLDIRLAVGLKDFPNLVRQSSVDAVCLLLHWDQPTAELTDVVASVSQLPSRPRLILLDQVDQTCSPFFGLFKHVDVVLKSQILRDAHRYTQPSRSGYLFADYLAENPGYQLGDWHFGERADPGDLPKLRLGWNLGISRRCAGSCDGASYRQFRGAGVDLTSIAGSAVNRTTITAGTRPIGGFALERYLQATRGARCTATTRVSATKYLLEMARSKFVFSPFGWGEVCYRDFEAIALGALLIKPSMDHLVTRPDIYSANETYVPVRWDLSDLDEKCQWCLSNPNECVRIIRNARRVLKRYLACDFASSVQEALNGAGER